MPAQDRKQGRERRRRFFRKKKGRFEGILLFFEEKEADRTGDPNKAWWLLSIAVDSLVRGLARETSTLEVM